ncbi:hypothetical protein MPL3365_140173 [Mesorhizobium plurifarium]|uniref:Uncharacterized protein n=1 Tax=Mesorhizobium plurifarium TaxID=69974 RepID=A0A090FXS3_MESPL|nr:hypothetical protein MPL3365_140173 [Mesorhizobium plurifarium]
MSQVAFPRPGGCWSCGDRSIDRDGGFFSAGAIQIKMRGRGMLGPRGRSFGLERFGADPRALVSHIAARETLGMSIRKLFKVASTDKLHLVAASTDPEQKLFHDSRKICVAGGLGRSRGPQALSRKLCATGGQVRRPHGRRPSGNRRRPGGWPESDGRGRNPIGSS